METKPRVFISHTDYAEADRRFTDFLIGRSQASEIPYWIDRENPIPVAQGLHDGPPPSPDLVAKGVHDARGKRQRAPSSSRSGCVGLHLPRFLEGGGCYTCACVLARCVPGVAPIRRPRFQIGGADGGHVQPTLTQGDSRGYADADDSDR